jgi:hypothetical protein
MACAPFFPFFGASQGYSSIFSIAARLFSGPDLKFLGISMVGVSLPLFHWSWSVRGASVSLLVPQNVESVGTIPSV